MFFLGLLIGDCVAEGVLTAPEAPPAGGATSGLVCVAPAPGLAPERAWVHRSLFPRILNTWSKFSLSGVSEAPYKTIQFISSIHPTAAFLMPKTNTDTTDWLKAEIRAHRKKKEEFKGQRSTEIIICKGRVCAL